MKSITDYSEEIFDSYRARMATTPQHPQWHGEGDVLTHTQMVCEALRSLPEFNALDAHRRNILLAAARLHDIGKTITTRDIGGVVDAPHHAPAGARLVRAALWRAGLCGSPEAMRLREAVCLLIRYHSIPPHAIDAADGVLRLHRIASCGLMVPEFTVRMLCLLSRADMLGRKCADKEEVLAQIALCEELAADEGCLDGPYPFPAEYTGRAYLSGRDVWKNQELYPDTWGTVYMMSGLPGTGKDTWIKKHLPDIPMVSLDEIRREYRISPTQDQGFVANVAREQARDHLRRHESFVWNATNLTASMRRQLVELFESYHARVHIIYLETDRDTLLSRNGGRAEAVPPAVIESMLDKLVPPEPHEAEKVIYEL